MFKFQPYHRQVTPSGNSVSFNTDVIHGRLSAVRVKPATGSSSWHIKITGPNGFITYESDSGTTTGEETDAGVAGFLSLVKGIYTIAITSAVDEVHDVQLDVEQYQLV